MSQNISDNLNIGSGVSPDIVLSQQSGINTVFNANKQNIDFKIYSTGNSNLTYDASTGRLGVGTGLPDAVLHVVAPCAKDGLIVESVTNCPTGVTLLLVHNPQTAPQSGSYPAIVNLAGRDTNYNEIYYGQILSKILDPNTGATSGEIIFTVDHTGVNKPVFVANLANVILGGNNVASGSSYDVVGNYNILSGVLYNNIGSYNSGIINSGIVIGNSNIFNGNKLFVFANNSVLSGVSGISIGNEVISSGSNNILLGNIVSVTGLNNILLGSNNSANISSTVGLAQDLNSVGASGIVLGSNIVNTGSFNIYIGNNTSVSGSNNNLIGSLVYLTGNNNLSYGNQNVVNGNNLICIGSYQTASNINSGIFIGNSIGTNDADRSIVIGIGNTNSSDQQGLSDSILLGVNNTLVSGMPDKLLLIGQNNIVKDIANSLVIGNQNNASGIVNNNLLVGNTNSTPIESNNNIVLGLLNNQTGVYIDSAGNISGVPRRVNANVNNSIVAGIHNIQTSGLSNNIIGNKNAVSGSNDNVIGSFNSLRNASRSYSVGNSNYLVGNNLGAMGSKNLIVGQESLVFNNANKRMDIFGSGNIVLGYNQLVPGGLIVGTDNKTYGQNNTIYGRNNTLGSVAHAFVMNSLSSSTVTISSLVANRFTVGDTALLVVQSPASSGNTFIREILDVVENPPENNTIIQFSTSIVVNASNGYYSINENFDDNNISNTTVSGLIMPYAVGGGVGGLETNPVYGSNNIVVGSNNRYIYSSGTVIGFNNNVSGVRNVVVGYGLSGVADNTLYIGTNNNNKIILDNERTVFNSGKIQDNFIVKSTSDNTSVLNIDLNNNRVGVNTNSPTADLSVSGLTSTSTVRVGFSSPDQYVLTSNVNGFGTWQLPVRLSGFDTGLMCKTSDKVSSGISNIYFDSAGNSLNFNLDNNNGLVINPTGIFVNDGGNIYAMRIRGSGGSDFARVLFNTNFGNNRIDFFNISGNSGILNNLSVNSGLIFPTSLTGTFLYVNNSGRLLSYGSRPYAVLYANDGSWATGDTSFRWFNNQSVLAMGATGIVNYDILATNTNDTNYNILLSSNSGIDTIFNNRGLGGSKFSIINSGALNTRRGLHINSASGQVAINVIPDTYNIVTNQAHLYVDGRTWTNSLRIGPGSTTSGLYLRVDSAGNVVPSTLDLTTQFSGAYPVNTTYTSLGQNNAFRVDIGLQNVDRAGNSLGGDNDGQYLIWDGVKWNLNKGIIAPQSAWLANNDRSLKGVMFGHQAKINYTYHTHAFAAGSFHTTQTNMYNGSAQFTQHYLRCRTPVTGGNVAALTTNFAKDSVTTENQYNTITLANTNGYDYDNVWTYNIFLSVLWQDGTSSNPIDANNPPPRYAAGMTIQGSIYRSADGATFTKLGQERVNIFSTGVGVVGLPAGMGVGTYLDNDTQTNMPRLSIRATGVDGKTALWTATAQIHQLNHPGSFNLYGNT